jgi:hypothetical protein
MPKSSSSSFRITPVIGSRTWEPKTRFTVEVTATAIPDASTIEVWDCIVIVLLDSDFRKGSRFNDGETYRAVIYLHVKDRLVILW